MTPSQRVSVTQRRDAECGKRWVVSRQVSQATGERVWVYSQSHLLVVLLDLEWWLCGSAAGWWKRRGRQRRRRRSSGGVLEVVLVMYVMVADSGGGGGGPGRQCQGRERRRRLLQKAGEPAKRWDG